MSYRIRIESFEGPFDLLLYLVSRQKVDVGTISITEIADQYLAEISRMQKLDLDVASDFLLTAATLLKIKAESLLPQGKEDVDEDLSELVPSQARDMLVDKLIEYKTFKNAGAALASKQRAESRMHARMAGASDEFTGLMPDYLAGVRLEDLASKAASLLSQREIVLLESEHIAAKPIPVERYVKTIFSRLTKEKKVRFSSLIEGDTRPEKVVVTFLAILELHKRGYVSVRQKETFGDIDVTYIEGSGELALVDSEFDAPATNGARSSGDE